MGLKAQILVLVSMAIVAIGFAGEYSGDKVLRIFPATDLQVNALINLEETEPLKYDFWQYPRGLGKATDIHIKAQDCKNFTSFLSSKNMTYGILVEDLQSLMDHQNDSPKLADATADIWYDRYHPFDEIEEKLEVLVNNSNGGVSAELFSIGKTIEDREQLAVKITSGGGSYKPVIFINCGIHAREWVGPATCMYMIDQLINKYCTDATVKEALDKIDFIILPVLNVDGYVFSWTYNKRLWRKNRRRGLDDTESGCIGVDLNRNFPFGWGTKLTKGAASPFVCSDIFAGKSAESEPEVQNVANYLRDLAHTGSLKAYFDIHSYSQMWMIPWGYTKKNPADYDELMRVAELGSEELYKYNSTDYEVGSSSTLLYVNTGTTKDFVYGELNVPYTYVLELRDRGEFGFLLPAWQILDTARETFGGIKAAVKEMNLDYIPNITKSNDHSITIKEEPLP